MNILPSAISNVGQFICVMTNITIVNLGVKTNQLLINNHCKAHLLDEYNIFIIFQTHRPHIVVRFTYKGLKHRLKLTHNR